MAAAAALGNSGEPKGQLNHFAQRYCKRPITKQDIVYTSAKYGEVYQVTVTMNCMDGQQFVGETAALPKEAEKNAASQALAHFAPMFDSLPAPEGKNKKRKAEGGEVSVAKVAKTSTAAEGENPALTAKVLLNNAMMTVLRRPLAKGEVSFETNKTPQGYQSTVKLPCLPGEWADLAWAGECADNQKQAEQNAAKEAVEAVNADMEAIKALLPDQPAKPAKTNGKGADKGAMGKGKMMKGGWDMWGMKGMKGMMMMKGKGKDMGWGWDKGGKGQKGPVGPLPRTRISDVAVTGEILEWKGNYGWLKPHAEIDSPAAKKRQGKVFLSRKDIVGSVDFEVGTMVTFQVYEDASGLGAEECSAF